ncbi:hypothetical protein H5410_034999 [Solanum commersonii]|uniref:Uncharacterized protein n=1 Tax=Solanum commersonii TaxID=4109 RepID=A0A9J5Y1N8_SOLCO|nr:hypothetical protein H5410_034999 [Solanum commersonii]
MNAQNKSQLTHARINYALNGSSCDSQLPKILKFTILASNASSNSTKLTQDQKGLSKACTEAECKGIPSFFNTMGRGEFLHIY